MRSHRNPSVRALAATIAFAGALLSQTPVLQAQDRVLELDGDEDYVELPAGLLAISVALLYLPGAALRLRDARALDHLSLLLMATGLAALVIAIKEAPERGWASGAVLALLALSLTGTAGFARRTLRLQG